MILYLCYSSFHLVIDPKILHLHRARLLVFYGAVGDSDGSSILQWVRSASRLCPNSSKVMRMMRALRRLRNNIPSAASAADDATNFRIVDKTNMALLRLMGLPSLGIPPQERNIRRLYCKRRFRKCMKCQSGCSGSFSIRDIK